MNNINNIKIQLILIIKKKKMNKYMLYMKKY